MRVNGMSLLEIKNLHASVDGNEILKGIDLTVNAGEVHCHHGAERLGQEHAGAGAGAARDATKSPTAQISFDGKDLLEMEPEERAREGVFLAFQYPVEIPGVSNAYFLRAR